MKYHEYIKRFIGKVVKIKRSSDAGIYIISPGKKDKKSPYNRDDILEVHDDFIVIRIFLGGGAPGVPPCYEQEVVPIHLIKFNLGITKQQS